MADSCLNNPGLQPGDVLASFGRAFAHNGIQPPPFLAAEAAAVYLPRGCSAAAGGGAPRCCRVYEDFWQDLNMQCSEDVLFEAIRAGAVAAGRPPPPLFGWRFDAVRGIKFL